MQRNFQIEVRYRHFPLHPETPTSGLTLEQLFAGRGIDIPAAKARMKSLMAAERLPYGERTMTFNSRLAQELAAWAETQPQGDLIHLELFRSYFVSGENIGLVETLVDVAERAGLDGAEAEDVVRNRRFRSAVDEDWESSRARGVTGVPTFVVGNRGVVGGQPYEALEAFLASCDVERRERTS